MSQKSLFKNLRKKAEFGALLVLLVVYNAKQNNFIKKYGREVRRMRKQKIAKRIGTFLLTAVVAFSSVSVWQKPVAVKAADPVYQVMTVANGFNADVFYDNGESSSSVDSCESTGKVAGDKACFYTQDAGVSSIGGFPTNGVIVDESNPQLTWQLAGYKQNNALRLAPGDNGTLTFSTVGCYQKLYFLVTAGGVGVGSNAQMNVTVTYSDGLTSEEVFTVVDWYDSNNSVTAKYQRMYDSYYGARPDGSVYDGPYLTKCEMAIDTTKLISDIKISNNSGQVFVCVYGVTGLTDSIDAPVLNDAANVTHDGFQASWSSVEGAGSYRFDLATDKNFTHMVGNYNNFVVNGTTLNITGLSSSQVYYYRVRAVKDGGGQSASSAAKSVSLHNWQFSSSDLNIIATCTANDCSESVSLTLGAEDKEYTGEAYTGATVDAENFNLYTGKNVTASDVQYYLDEALSSPTTTENSGAASDKEAPKNVGNYYAALTVEGQTVKTAFKIEKISQTASVTMRGYYFSEVAGATVSTPGLRGAKENPDVVYYYNTTTSTEGAKEWKDIKADTLKPSNFYYMYAVLGETENYKATTTDFTQFSVYNGNFTAVTAESVTKTYDGKETGIKLTGVPEGATVKYGLSASACNLSNSPTIRNVADSPCTIYYSVQKDGYITKTGSATVTINPRTAELVWSATSFVYDGTMQAPSVSVGNLTEGDACVVTVTGSKKDVGDYTAEASALSNSNYKLPDDVAKTFSIAKRPLDLVWQKETTFTYNGKEQGITATPGNVVDGDTVTLTYKDNMKKEVGTYTAVVTGIDNENYVLPAITEQSYKIEKQVINGDDNNISIRFDKDGNEKVYSEVEGEQVELVRDVDYTVEKTEDGYIKIVGIGGYESEIKVKQPETSGDGRIVTSVVVETEIEEIQPTLSPVTETNAKNTLLNVIKSEEVKAKVAAGENIEYDATLYLKLLDANETASGDDKSLVAKQIVEDASIPSYAKVGMYLDLTLYMSYSVSDVSGVLESGTDKIKDTSDEKMGAGKGYHQEVTITIPEELRNTNEKIKRSYYVIRVHEDASGTKTVEQVQSSQKGYNLTFTTDKFSIYAIAYSDEAIPEIEKPNDAKVEQPTTEAVPAPTTVKDTSPATGDMAHPVLWMAMMFLAVLAIAGVWSRRKKDCR